MSVPAAGPGAAPHRARAMAESFGVDPQRYDRARPPYPNALVRRVLDRAPGGDVLDVGCGTGIAARQFAAAGGTVLGIEPDARMAGYARSAVVPVEVATFEAWDPAGRTFDAVVAGQSWHWVDPAVGSARAAAVLRPGGRLAVFGHVFEPPEHVAAALATALRSAVPDAPDPGLSGRRPLELYEKMYRGFGEAVEATGAFGAPERWRFDWERVYTRDEWLDLLPTTGNLTRLPAERLTPVLDAVAAAIDTGGGGFTMSYTTLCTTAARRG